MQNLFTIGEIAAIFDETTETFRHYDRVNLLKPHIVKDNGYRYYSLDQFEMISTILYLRSLGTSIIKIKNLLNSRSKTEIVKELKLQKLQLRSQIDHLNYLENQTSVLVNRFESFINNDISLVVEPEFFILEQKFASNQLALNADQITSFKDNIDSEWLKSSNIISIIDKDMFLKNIYHTYSGYGLISESSSPISNDFYQTVPSQLYVTAYIRIVSFDHSEIDNLYLKMLEYITNNQLTILGSIFERNLLDLYNDKNTGDIHYIKIYIPVKKDH
ncbi:MULTISPECIES: MerR family transcriptional regulator [unclassified Fusibacter]|uniref:MerR family transcriptional regulator n=1 Tax=unclassified Fusibacter TaxID=2624464 RepID=UPI001010CE46|nr:MULTISPECIES: MerR family transcriptional regulator [unclassified Fusibacter]MCK8061620.1 MerR family transcriptional regulator [Fusibacter sp. A2]NPE23803.1 MerR family transcriptional regulator [Fusibacter sp. A1]RXV58641.1 MerR family transcriptional regulator [Fusibacter sp. A1]